MSAAHMGIGAKPVTSCEIKESYADGTQLVKFVSYASAREAERKTGFNNANISDCCNKRQKSAGGTLLVFYRGKSSTPDHMGGRAHRASHRG